MPMPIRAKLADETLTLDQLDELMGSFVKAAEEGKCLELGWKEALYVTSKVGVSAMTRVHQRNFARDRPDDDIAVNHVSPGYVKTGMSGYKGFYNADEGAESSVYAATLPRFTQIKGKFIYEDCKVRDWITFNPKSEEPYKSMNYERKN